MTQSNREDLNLAKFFSDLETLGVKSDKEVDIYFGKFREYISKITDEVALEKFKIIYQKDFIDPSENLAPEAKERFDKIMQSIEKDGEGVIRSMIMKSLDDSIPKTDEDRDKLEKFKQYCNSERVEFDQIRDMIAYQGIFNIIGVSDIDKKLSSEFKASQIKISTTHVKKIDRLAKKYMSDKSVAWGGLLPKIENLIKESKINEYLSCIKTNPNSLAEIMRGVLVEIGELIYQYQRKEDTENIERQIREKIYFMVELLSLASKIHGVHSKLIDDQRAFLVRQITLLNERYKLYDLTAEEIIFDKINKIEALHHGDTMDIAARLHIVPQPIEHKEDTLLERQKKVVRERLAEAKKTSDNNIVLSIQKVEEGLDSIKSEKELRQELIHLKSIIPLRMRHKIKISEIRRDITPVTHLSIQSKANLIKKINDDIDKKYPANTAKAGQARAQEKAIAEEKISHVKVIGDLKSIANTCSHNDAKYAVHEVIKKALRVKLDPNQPQAQKMSLGGQIASMLKIK